ncbi:MAG: hypothetical protein EBU46_13510 [Nitrosomonadaceae bacterium]|nr:hypothetical protein [Nitrosomonadaceae bacterium]
MDFHHDQSLNILDLDSLLCIEMFNQPGLALNKITTYPSACKACVCCVILVFFMLFFPSELFPSKKVRYFVGFHF